MEQKEFTVSFKITERLLDEIERVENNKDITKSHSLVTTYIKSLIVRALSCIRFHARYKECGCEGQAFHPFIDNKFIRKDTCYEHPYIEALYESIKSYHIIERKEE